MDILHIQLLGEFRLVYGETLITTVNSPRLQSLLAYLLLHRKAPQSRRHLAFLLWPDSNEGQARTNLRHAFHDLKHALPNGDTFLISDTLTLQWRSDAPFTSDVDKFLSLLQTPSLLTLTEAAQCYRGMLLPGCYDEWIGNEREQLHQSYIETLARLVTLYTENGDYPAAIHHTQQLLRADPLREETYRHLLHLYASNGDQTGIVRAYKTCVEILQRELGVEPDPETVAAYTQALKASATRRPIQRQALSNAVAKRSPNLPNYLTRFVGRQTEKLQLKRLVANSQLVTITGSGGAGKTRLALEAATELAATFADGVCWVELAVLNDETLLVNTLATTLGLFVSSGAVLIEVLCNYLGERHLLLILDNCEHLRFSVATLVVQLLQRAPRLHILTTSRIPLGIAGEVVWSLPPLPIPTTIDLTALTQPMSIQNNQGQPFWSSLQQVATVQLFVERATTILPTFTLTLANALPIAQICQRLDGIPLAIELAAARVKVLTVQQILTRLDQALHLLVQNSPTATPRQQTLRATLDWSYALLLPEEQRLFCWLAVFAGSFSLDALEAMAEAQNIMAHQVLDCLSALVDQSLVNTEQFDGQVRFRFHEVVRQYANEKLLQSGQSELLQHSHLRFYLQLVETAEQHLFGSPQQIAWLNQLEVEQDNLRAALHWSLQASAHPSGECSDAALRIVGALWMFWFIRGYFHEGARWCEQVLPTMQHSYCPPANWIKALNSASACALYLGDKPRAAALAQECLALAQQIGDATGMVVSHHRLALQLLDQGNFGEAEEHLRQGLLVAQAVAKPWFTYILTLDQGFVAAAQGQHAHAIACFTQTLTMARAAHDKFSMFYALNNLTPSTITPANYTQAKAIAEECLALQREIGGKRGLALTLLQLMNIAGYEGDVVTAYQNVREAVTLTYAIGDPRCLTISLFELANLDLARGANFRAAQLLAAISSAFQQTGLSAEQQWQRRYASLAANLQTKLGNEAFDLAWLNGKAMSLVSAVHYALTVQA